MFPILEIEAFYTQYMKGQLLDVEGIEGVAKLTEEWLLGFEGARDPAMAAIQNLCLKSSVEYDKRMLMALSLALCFPSEQTGRVFHAYRAQISEEMYNIQQWVTGMSMALDQHSIKTDVAKALGHVSIAQMSLACDAYRVSRQDVVMDAIAWDDLALLDKTLAMNEESTKNFLLTMLAKFEPEPASRIYQSMILTEQDEKDYFFYQTQEVRDLLFDGSFQGNFAYARPVGERWATLTPDGISGLQKGHPGSDQIFYQREDFTHNLMREPDRILKAFFRHFNVGAGNPQNDLHANIIVQAFLAAGIPAATIIEHGPCGPSMAIPFSDHPSLEPMSLQKAMRCFEAMRIERQAFYIPLFSDYLKDFTTAQIIELCTTPESLAGAYCLTRDKTFLQAGNDAARSRVMGHDLGL